MTKPTLLMVDDEERILRSLRMLFMANYNVRMTTDAHEAIRILKDEKVHVIISDQRMPIMQGSELLRIARETSPATMRILLTGYSDLNASIDSVNEGEVFRYLLKPWVGEEVKKVVADAAEIAEASFSVKSVLCDENIHVQGRSKVLVMDSDISTGGIVFEILGNSCEIILARTEQDALNEIARHQDISVVVSDVILGGINVSYILKTIKQINPMTQTLIVAAQKDTGSLIELINQAQIARYIPKPISVNLLKCFLESILLRSRILASEPTIPNRQVVAPISNPTEKTQASKFMSLLGKIREKLH